jgi:hypothetical protein
VLGHPQQRRLVRPLEHAQREWQQARHQYDQPPPPATSIIDLPMQWPALVIAVVCAVVALLK